MRFQVSKELLFTREMGVYNAFLTELPPEDYVRDPDKADLLQEFVANHCKPEFVYATALSIMEAATDISVSQIENGNEVPAPEEPT